MRVAPLLLLLLAGLAVSACGEKRDTRVRGDTLTVYVSVPREGVSAATGDGALAGVRTALAEAGGRVRGRRVRIVALSSTQAPGPTWDPGAVTLAAERAAKDPTAIAYIGELDSGASAVSLPVTNAARLLQVSPSDGLTSLTRPPPGRARAGPERLRPEGVRSFLRLVPNDLRVARTLMRRVRRVRGGRVAIVHTEGVAEVELATLLARFADTRGIEPVVIELVRDDPDRAEGVVREVAASSADAVVLAGVRGPGTGAVLRALANRLPGVEVLCTPTLLRSPTGAPNPRCDITVTPVTPARGQTRSARRVIAKIARDPARTHNRRPPAGEALHAYEAMRIVLEAIARGGPDRDAVIAAALAPRERRSVLGRYAVRRTGDVSGLAVSFVASARDSRRRGGSR